MSVVAAPAASTAAATSSSSSSSFPLTNEITTLKTEIQDKKNEINELKVALQREGKSIIEINNQLTALNNQLTALNNQLVELQKEKNLLLEEAKEHRQALAASSTSSSSSSSASAAAAFPPLPGHAVSGSVGRVFVSKFVSGPNESTVPDHSCDFAGQCVCVVHPRLLLTATHVCFDDITGEKLFVRVGFKANRDSQLQLFAASVLRWSGKMDVAVLLLESEQSPFTPLPVATEASISEDIDSGQLCALASFAVSTDGAAIRSAGQNQPGLVVPQEQLTRLPFRPNFLKSEVAAVQLRRLFDPSPKREFLIAISTYPNEKGVSGGAVVGMEDGRVVLFGVHTHNQRLGSSESYSYLASRLQVGEFDGPELETASAAAAASDPMSYSQQLSRLHDSHGSDAEADQRHSDTNSHHSAPDAESPSVAISQQVKGKGKAALQATAAAEQLQNKLAHVSGATASKSVFVVAHSFLQGRWSSEVLIQDVANACDPATSGLVAKGPMNTQGDTSSSFSATAPVRQLSFRLPSAKDSPNGSPRLSTVKELLYGDG